MNKFILIALIIITFPLDLYPQSSWFWLQPKPTGATLNGVDFINKNTGYTCGKTGVVTKTTNAGTNWTLLEPLTVYDLTDIECLDANTCIVVGKNGLIMKTTDGGKNWTVIPSGVTVSLEDINFVSFNVGFITGASGVLLKSTNSGNSWGFISLKTTSTLHSVSFIDENNGVVGSLNRIYTTTNGGTNWTFQSFGSFFDYFETVQYVNDSVIYGLFIDFPFKTYKSTNKGATWEINVIEFLNPTGELPRWISFKDENTGFMVTSYGNIGKTVNGGLNWLLDTSFIPEYLDVQIFWKIKSVDTSFVYAVGSGGLIVRSTSNGELWAKQVGNIKTYRDIFFANNNTGFVAGEKGLLIKTVDAGLTWSRINLNTTLGIKKIFFTNENTGYICGDSGLVMKTTNTGVNWISQTTPAADTNLLSIYFLNENTGYIGVFYRSILKTTNGGLNWIRIYTNETTDIALYNDFDFLNDNSGYSVGENGLLKTTDGGLNWSKIFIGGTAFNSINYLDSSNIIAFGYTDRIIKSSNGGLSWFNINNQLGATIFSSQFFGSNHGIICGDLGRVGMTTNGGINWTLQPFVASEYLYSIYFTDPNTGYAVGQAGQIIKTTNGGLSFIKSQASFTPEDFILHQNYPNPFNPKTQINFELKKSGSIRIDIYDAAGKSLKTLTNKFHALGKYSLEFDASGFSSGVYFYTIYANDILADTKKCLLIK